MYLTDSGRKNSLPGVYLFYKLSNLEHPIVEQEWVQAWYSMMQRHVLGIHLVGRCDPSPRVIVKPDLFIAHELFKISKLH